jgi:SNF2 family DNA or RNA helicase
LRKEVRLTKLYEHQRLALEATADKSRVAYYHDQGLGKTFTGAEKMHQLGAVINLIICQKSKIDDWMEHFRTYYSYVPEFTYDLTDPKQLKRFLNHATHADDSDCECAYGIINYDLAWRRKELTWLEDFTLMLDESSLIQHEDSKRSKFILKLHPENVILLSGTPTGGKYETLWSQMHLLGWNISKEMYYNHYIDYHWDDSSGFPRMAIDGYKRVDRLKKKMRAYGCHFLKTEDCIDLPEQIDLTIKVPIIKEYKVFKEDRICTINDTELVGDTTLTKLLYERQLCGQYNKDKLKAFLDLVESTNDRLIVFYNFTAEMEAMQDILLDEDFEGYSKRFSVVNGKLKALKNYENKDDSITFIQYQAGAMGLNLQKANRIIYYTPPLSSELFEQSKKRIHRIGQGKTCFYYYLTCKGSVEEKIYKTLAMRKDYTDKLFEEGE